MDSDDELKDEELVDFEGSDYDLDGDFDDVEEAEEERQGQEEGDLVHRELREPPNAEGRGSGGNGALTVVAFRSTKVTDCSAVGGLAHQKVFAYGSGEPVDKASNGASDSKEAVRSMIAGLIEEVTNVQRSSSLNCQVNSEVAKIIQSTNSTCFKEVEHGRTSMDGGEIMNEQNQEAENATSGPAPSTYCHTGSTLCTSDHSERVPGLASSKPDLEDGELVETAVPLNHGLDTEEEAIGETSGREKKRRMAGSIDSRDMAGKHHLSSGSDKAMEHLAGLAYADGRGMGSRMIALGQGSLAPGIMGPGRPLLPLGIGNLAQGFNPFGGLTPPGWPQVHLQEVLAQEHLLRVHALQLAQETIANAIRPPLTRPLGAAALQPFMGFDVPGPRSHALKHFPRPAPDLFMGTVGGFARGQRPNLPAGRPGASGKVGGPADSNFCTGTRQFGLPAVSRPNDLQSSKWARGRGGGFGVWEDSADSFAILPGGFVLAGHPRPIMNAAAASSIPHLNPEDPILYPISLGASRAESDVLHNGFDARWKIEKERMLRNGSPHLRMLNSPMMGENLPGGGRDLIKDSAKFGEVRPLRSQDSFKTGGLAARLGRTGQVKVAKPNEANSGDLAVASNVIKLHQPIRKSRVISVSGLPEDTPISTVVEVFEKLGKITDFKKSTKGGIFTLSYSSETEAVAAKRNLHRSYIAGKQITVDYTHP